eukprot:TRINITY_DN65696_c0_g1_i1.p1 TRINITY_DN65696_c0_g1~~TRINITY_DN65696_c0_g1_i1.p1  ORF type:complete len:813 (+),score=437.17 TRINITY_DN65696_c0_g1_i1:28-2439(+)
MRIQYKGGVWKNTEDEILKAGVMKYGKNHWARIASLLARKSAKQCKARWNEWLDPSIKKTEWTREEEEKLLHLAKIMPTQWRTIAPMVGRTPQQCLAHYEKLLDAAQRGEDELQAASASSSSSSSSTAAAGLKKNDPRRLQPGEIDPNPESRPARPDPVDMDEDEKEMLSEARARLANTRGKKAKRKAREKIMQEARRLAALQKKRELKAAGIQVNKRKRKRKRNEIDLATEVPFEKVAPRGFYDTSEELARSRELREANAHKFIGKDLRQIEGRSKRALEDIERKKDAKRQKLLKKANPAAYIERVNKLNDPLQIQRRAKLVLPAPQVDDEELVLATSSAAAASAPSDEFMMSTPVGAASASATSSKLSTRGGKATPMRTPMRGDTVRTEALRLRALTAQQTPLAAHSSDEQMQQQASQPQQDLLRGADFSGMTPRSLSASTPNPFATPAAGKSKRQAKQERQAVRRMLRSGLEQLPAPKKEFMIVMPELPSEAEVLSKFGVDLDEHQQGDGASALADYDAEELESISEARREALRVAALKRRTQVVQRGLPMPSSASSEYFAATAESEDETATADALIRKEMLVLMLNDRAENESGDEKDQKSSQKKRKKKKQKKDRRVPRLQRFSDVELEAARALLQREVEGKKDDPMEIDAGVWTQASDDVAYVPRLKTYARLSQAKNSDRLAAMEQAYHVLATQVLGTLRQAAKVEQRLNLLHGGYERRAEALKNEISSVHERVTEAVEGVACFKELHKGELDAIPRRLSAARRELKEQRELERQLQSRHEQLVLERERLLETLNATQ